MENIIRRKIPLKGSEAKPLVKPRPGDKTMVLESEISFYIIEEGDAIAEGE